MIQQLKKGLFFIGLLLINQGAAIERQPWLGNIYEFEFQSSLLYQHFQHYSSGPHLKKFSADDSFLSFSLKNAINDIGAEFEITEAWTRRQQSDIDHFSLAGRYIWLDDVAGDPITLTTGVSFTQAFRHSLYDISSFHHGKEEGELFISIGKEKAYDMNWDSRAAAIFALGIAEKGSPWVRFNLNFEKRFTQSQELKIFLNTLWGLGKHRLHAHHFKGYSAIQHHSIDVGLRYTYLLEFIGNLNLEYTYRLYALNFPIYSHRLQLEFLYTFGL